jgi:UDP-N-acetylmuramate--alanine ligase
MVAEAFVAAHLDPTALVGARVAKWNGNLRGGGDRFYVAEADEYDRSFLALSPTVAVVTNVEADHLDVYADLEDIRRAFAQFVHGARHIVLCADDPGATSLSTPPSSAVIRYGMHSPHARLRARDVQSASTGTSFGVEFDGDRLGDVRLRVPGVHNVLNALAAIGAGLALGAPFDRLAAGLAEFAGIARRFEHLGTPAASPSSTTTRTIPPKSTPHSARHAPVFPEGDWLWRSSRTCFPARVTSRPNSPAPCPAAMSCSSPRSMRPANSRSPA